MSAHEPGGQVDSFGVPWAGRTLTPQPFAGDDGLAQPALVQALAGHAAGRLGADDVVEALAAARVMVAVVAVIGQEHPLPTAARGDAGADMALVTLTGRDGRRALPVFTGTPSLTSWDAGARPVPVEAARAAQAAVAEGCDVLVVDPDGPVTFVVPRPAVWALGQGRAWVPSPRDPVVAAAVDAALAGAPGVLGVRCEPGRAAELRVVLGLRAGLDQAALDVVLADLRERLAQDRTVAERVDSVELHVVPA